MTRWGWRVARASRLMWTGALPAGLLLYGPLALWCLPFVAASLLLERYWRQP